MLVRRLEFEDLSARTLWFNDSEVYGQMSVDFPCSVADTQHWFLSNRLNPKRRDFCFLIEGQDKSNELAAMGGLTDIEPHHMHAELYIVVKPSLIGRGYGQKAILWLCNYGFIELGLMRIYLHTLEGNARARSLYECLGFTVEGVLRQHVHHRGRFENRYVQSLLRHEWKNKEWMVTPPLSLEIPIQ